MANTASLAATEDTSPEPHIHGVLKKPGVKWRRNQPTVATQVHEDEEQFFGKPAMENSFKMVPDTRFNYAKAAKRAEDILQSNLEGIKYEPEKCKQLAQKTSEELKESVKSLGSERFKFVCVVYVGPFQSQGIRIASRCLMDERFDRCATATYRSHNLYAVATIYAIYWE